MLFLEMKLKKFKDYYFLLIYFPLPFAHMTIIMALIVLRLIYVSVYTNI